MTTISLGGASPGSTSTVSVGLAFSSAVGLLLSGSEPMINASYLAAYTPEVIHYSKFIYQFHQPLRIELSMKRETPPRISGVLE